LIQCVSNFKFIITWDLLGTNESLFTKESKVFRVEFRDTIMTFYLYFFVDAFLRILPWIFLTVIDFPNVIGIYDVVMISRTTLTATRGVINPYLNNLMISAPKKISFLFEVPKTGWKDKESFEYQAWCTTGEAFFRRQTKLYFQRFQQKFKYVKWSLVRLVETLRNLPVTFKCSCVEQIHNFQLQYHRNLLCKISVKFPCIVGVKFFMGM
jgi:hypothetical protein